MKNRSKIFIAILCIALSKQILAEIAPSDIKPYSNFKTRSKVSFSVAQYFDFTKSDKSKLKFTYSIEPVADGNNFKADP